MTSKIASILEILIDGEWHAIVEIRRIVEIDEAQLQPIMDFLNEYSFIVCDEAGKKVRLNKLTQEFLTARAT